MYEVVFQSILSHLSADGLRTEEERGEAARQVGRGRTEVQELAEGVATAKGVPA